MNKRMIATATASIGASSLLGLCSLGTMGGVAAAAPAVSPAGSYHATVTFTGQSPIVVGLTLTSTGHFSFPGGATGTWSEKNKVVTMKSDFHDLSSVWVITQLGKNLGSKAKQGTYSSKGTVQGTWYAIRG